MCSGSVVYQDTVYNGSQNVLHLNAYVDVSDYGLS